MQQLAHQWISALDYWEMALVAGLSFAVLYFGFAFFAVWMTGTVFPKWKVGTRIEQRPLAKGQIQREIRLSLVSILIFALYAPFTFLLERTGRIQIEWEYSLARLAGDLALLILWNEVYFYACHFLLHRKSIYRYIHRVHHLSIVPSPFSTYSLHWAEAFILSAVMVLFLLMRSLSFGAILLYPVISLFMNTIGHMNYAIFPNLSLNHVFASARRHTLHHTHFTGNFGFSSPWLDRLFQSRVKP